MVVCDSDHGSNQYSLTYINSRFSMQVVNHNYPVTKFEVSTDSGKSWQPTVRQDYNYWQKSSGDGFLVDTVSVRVTCSNGKQVVVNNVGTKEKASFTASGNC